MDEWDELWTDREEYISVTERKDPFCTCEEFGEESCPIHSQEDLDIVPDEFIEALLKDEDEDTNN